MLNFSFPLEVLAEVVGTFWEIFDSAFRVNLFGLKEIFAPELCESDHESLLAFVFPSRETGIE